MNSRLAVASLLSVCLLSAGCVAPDPKDGRRSAPAASSAAPAGVDPQLAAYIAKIKAVDNHTHANSVAPGDTDYDALPLDALMPIELAAPLHDDNPIWVAAYQSLYKYPHNDRSEEHMKALRATMQSVAKEQGEKFPTWVLDQIGTEVLLANRMAMGPGLTTARFRQVSYVDALMFPLSNKAEATTTPDRKSLYPLEEKLLQRFYGDLKITARPANLEAYLKTVVTPTLEAQRQAGCVAVKFEVAYLRALDFDEASLADATRIYAKYAKGGEPTHAEYKTLQDFLFRYIVGEAGRLGMASHIHSFEGVGNSFRTSGIDPMLLESAVTDPALRQSNIVIVHGGGIFSDRAGAMLWKPNVYVDMSLMTLAYPPSRLAGILRSWLTQFPEKVLFGSDAAAFGPDMGWEVTAWVGTHNARTALGLALTAMVRDGDVTRARAEEIATMVMRTNAAKLYKLDLK